MKAELMLSLCVLPFALHLATAEVTFEETSVPPLNGNDSTALTQLRQEIKQIHISNQRRWTRFFVASAIILAILAIGFIAYKFIRKENMMRVVDNVYPSVHAIQDGEAITGGRATIIAI
ncbi:hypothetical protein HDE_14220 [Halotydeus destructor]|nr:hypothetical protein HDE_14220 [Halotydeus destructor]